MEEEYEEGTVPFGDKEKQDQIRFHSFDSKDSRDHRFKSFDSKGSHDEYLSNHSKRANASGHLSNPFSDKKTLKQNSRNVSRESFEHEATGKNRKFDPFSLCRSWFWNPVDDVEEDIVPYFNMCACNQQDKYRLFFMRLTAWKWFDRFFMTLTLVDNVIAVLDSMLDLGVNSKMDILFATLYLIEVSCKITAWGLFGGTMSIWNSNIFNRVDLLVVFAAWLEVAARQMGFSFSMRPLKLLRLLKPLGQFDAFHGLESIMHTLEVGAIAMGTVLYLMVFFYVLFGVVGMELFAGSYSRKCVWADTLQPALPEQFCKRFGEKSLLKGLLPGHILGPGVALNSNCRPFQVCIDAGSPNFGFSNFDNMASSFITIFQAFTTDSQSYLMWGGIESEPDWSFLVILFFLSIAFVIDQALMNVFLAVLTTVFSCKHFLDNFQVYFLIIEALLNQACCSARNIIHASSITPTARFVSTPNPCMFCKTFVCLD